MRLSSLVVDKYDLRNPGLTKGPKRLETSRRRFWENDHLADVFWGAKFRRYRFGATVVALIFLIPLLGLPAQALAQSQFAGI